MKIAFAEYSGWDIDVQSADIIPLGGSQSAMCHLARCLAADGHDVVILGSVAQPGVRAGVQHLAWRDMTLSKLRALNLDALVCILSAGMGREMRPALGAETRLILWTQHTPDQSSVAPLGDASERACFDGFVMVSDWQREQFEKGFGIEPAKTVVLRNAIAPSFANLFADGESISKQKASPPVLAYTSTPFRGLELLVEAFPRIRAAVPGARLQVFSSMAVYQVPSSEDDRQFGALYQRCRETDGVEYFGSLPQPQLAAALRAATLFAYPNTFPETSCISAMEAMASGCRVVTSRLGALPETCAGFARLVPGGKGRAAYLDDFIESSILALREAVEDPAASERLLRAQVGQMNQTATWAMRAREWARWLGHGKG